MSEENEYFCPIPMAWEEHRTTEEELASWLECNNFKLDEKHMNLYEPEERFRIWRSLPISRFTPVAVKIMDLQKRMKDSPLKVAIYCDIHGKTYTAATIHWNINFAMALAINRWNKEVSQRCHPCEAHQFMIERRHITFC